MMCPNCGSSYVHIGDDSNGLSAATNECFTCTASWLGGHPPLGWVATGRKEPSPLEQLQQGCNDAGKEIRAKLYNWLYDCWDCRR